MSYTQKHIVTLFQEIVEDYRTNADIIAISDKGSGIYEMILSSISGLSANDYITIDNTIGFNSENQKIDSVNEINTTITITSSAGISIPSSFGSITANKPYFESGYWEEQRGKLILKSLSTLFKNQKFPLVFLYNDWTEVRDQDFRIIDLQLFIFDRADVRTFRSSPNDTNYAELRTIYDNIIDNLYNSQHVAGRDFEHSYKELPRRPNNLNEIVDCIQVDIGNLRLYGTC